MSNPIERAPTADEARALTEKITSALEVAWDLVERAYNQRVWVALGYTSWDSYCASEFGAARLRVPREEQSDVVASLRQAGLSTRGIAAATGMSKSSVSRALPGVPNGAPETQTPPVTGTDGKKYRVVIEKPATTYMTVQATTIKQPPLIVKPVAHTVDREALQCEWSDRRSSIVAGGEELDYRREVGTLTRTVGALERLHVGEWLKSNRAVLADRYRDDLKAASDKLLRLLAEL